MVRSCATFGLGVTAILILASLSDLKRPPPAVALFLIVMTAAYAALRLRAFVVRYCMLRSIRVQGGREYESLGLQLLGDFPEYIAAAAARFAQAEEHAAVPLIVRK